MKSIAKAIAALFVLLLAHTAMAASINEIRVDQSSSDNDEYFELHGTSGESLNGLTYLVIGDSSGGLSGVIEAVISLSGQTIPADGYFVAAESSFGLGTADLTTSLNFENTDNVTHILVSGFSGSNGQDLDSNDDGVLDVTPWTSVVDGVALIKQTNPPSSTEYEYGTDLGLPVLGPDGSAVPGHVARGPDGSGPWNIGTFGSLSDDTPGAANTPFFNVDVMLNEIRIDQDSTDNDEYAELLATPGALLDGFSLITIGDGSGGSGVIETSVDLNGVTVPNDGFLLIAESTMTIGTPDVTTSLNFENSDNLTHLVVYGFTGQVGDDLDTNDDGQLDITPWTSVYDAVAMVEEQNPPSSTEWEYATDQGYPAIGPDGSFVPGHIARTPDAAGIWQIGDFSSLSNDTPGDANVFFSAAIDVRLNEIRIDQDSTDTDEYAELSATAGTLLDGVSLVTIGDGSGGSGVIETAVDLTGVSVPGDGFLLIAESTMTIGVPDITTTLNFENSDNLTHLLVQDFTGNVGDDLDSNDDGQLDITPWTSVYDAVAMVEEQNPPSNTEWEYATSLGFPAIGPDGSAVPGHIARTPDAAAIWQIGDFSSLAQDTPGAANTPFGAGGSIGPYINEARIQQSGSNNDDYAEIYGNPNEALDGLSYIVIGDRNKKKASGVIEFVADLNGRSLNSNGLFVFAESNFSIGTADWQFGFNFENNDNVTHLLVRDFTGSTGDDLDTNDDGMLDSTPWSEVLDAVAFVKQANPPSSTEFEYATSLGFTAVGPISGGEPWHVYRMTDGGTWQAGSDQAGVTDTAGSSNGSADNPPSVITTVPADGATGVNLSSTVTINFSEDVSVTSNFYDISCPSSGVHSGTISGGPSSNVITPDVAFDSNEECTVIIFASDVTDLDGTADNMASNYVFRFTTEADVPPQVNSTSPADNATNIAVASNVDIHFSEPVTTSGSWYTFQCTLGGSINANVSGGPSDYTLDPVSDLSKDDTCTVTILAANVSDLDGTADNMTADYSFTFNTVPDVSTYYATVDSSNAASLRTTLHAVIDDHVWFPYTDSATDTWDILELADEDPMNPNNILDVYKNASYAKQGGGNSFYNREHTWPKSFGYPDLVNYNYPYTDTHMLFLSDSGYNSSRSNKPYDNCTAACSENTTDANNGVGGGSGVFPGNSNWTTGSFESGTWQTWVDRKGDVARALMYMDVRYEGGNHGGTGHSEPDLVLTDNRSLIQTTGSNATGTAYMGVLSVLIQWHNEDPPDTKEVLRNEVIFSYQGNRNPFIDHPEWVACIFQSVCN